ncbi:MAG: hypothetical protein MJZ03_05265 [archaeon]|nr:hypothetical protein [archaeon]
MNKTIKLFLALAIGAFAVFTNGCKPKEDVKDPSLRTLEADTLPHWMSLLPDDTPLFNLTIPCLHDAGTYYFNGDNELALSIKDQVYDYKDAWNWGARAFDLRIAYDYDWDGFAECCRFFHGDNETAIFFDYGPMNLIYDDVDNHFPAPSALDGECMILIVKKEYMEDESYTINVFEYLMAKLINKYGKDRFIAYHDNMTLGEARGKIIVIVRNEEYTHNYQKEVGGCTTPLVPINYATRFMDGKDDIITTITTESDLHVYVDAQKVATYKYHSQDIYDLKDFSYEKKYNAFCMLAGGNPMGHISFNGMNAVEWEDVIVAELPEGWDCCHKMNEWVSQAFEKHEIYGGGIILCDMYGATTCGSSIGTFHGDRLARAMIRHNFTK